MVVASKQQIYQLNYPAQLSQASTKTHTFPLRIKVLSQQLRSARDLVVPPVLVQRYAGVAGRLSEENRQGVPCVFVSTLHITTSDLSLTYGSPTLLVYTVHMYITKPQGAHCLTTYLQSAVNTILWLLVVLKSNGQSY